MPEVKIIYVVMKWGHVVDSVFDDYDAAMTHAKDLRRYSWKIGVHTMVMNRISEKPPGSVEL